MTAEVQDAHTIQVAICATRVKGASVRQVVDALELAEKYRLPCTVSELRAALHEMTLDPQDHHVTNGKMILLGITAGILTNFILRATRQIRSA